MSSVHPKCGIMDLTPFVPADPRNPVESRKPGRVLNVQDPTVFSAISTKKWGLKAFHTKTIF